MGARSLRRSVGLPAGALGLWVGVRAMRRLLAPSIEGHVAVVAGGSRGLGLLLARGLAEQGCRVAILARDEKELAGALEDLVGRGAEAIAVQCDLADRAQAERAIAEVTDELGRVDILINNASIIQVGPIETMTPEDFERTMGVNFFGTLYPTLAVIPQMRARRAGRIVNITSIGGKIAVPHLLPYDCAKFAAVGFSEGLRAELFRDGIRVTTVIPWLMRTGSPVNAFFHGRQELEYALFSTTDALPGISMSAHRAARRIIEATRWGEAEVTVGLPAKVFRLGHDLFPTLATDTLGLVASILPRGNGVGRAEARGMELSTRTTPSWLTTLMNRAARSLNQFGGRPRPSAEHARRLDLEEGD